MEQGREPLGVLCHRIATRATGAPWLPPPNPRVIRWIDRDAKTARAIVDTNWFRRHEVRGDLNSGLRGHPRGVERNSNGSPEHRVHESRSLPGVDMAHLHRERRRTAIGATSIYRSAHAGDLRLPTCDLRLATRDLRLLLAAPSALSGLRRFGRIGAVGRCAGPRRPEEQFAAVGVGNVAAVGAEQ